MRTASAMVLVVRFKDWGSGIFINADALCSCVFEVRESRLFSSRSRR